VSTQQDGTIDRSRQTTRSLLRLALRPDGTAFAAATAARPVDWQALLDLAEAHKLEALVAARAADAGPRDGRDAEAAARIDACRRNAAARADQAAATLRALAAAFEAARVPYFIIKGSVLAHEVYGAPDRRRFSDVDVVVRAADLARAEAALAQLGYRFGVATIAQRRLTGPEHALAERLMRGFAARYLGAHDWAAPATSGLLNVDLHWQIAPDRLRLGEAQLWEQVRTVRLDGIEIPTLAPPAMLVHLAAHATRLSVANFRLLHLCDLAWAAHIHAGALGAGWELAAQWGMRAHLERVFAMAEDVLEIELPRPPGATRAAGRRAVVDVALLFDAPRYAKAGLRTRLGPELRWGLAMRSLHINLPTFVAVAVARARFQRARRQHRLATPPPG
jgi:hypothetical protein